MGDQSTARGAEGAKWQWALEEGERFVLQCEASIGPRRSGVFERPSRRDGLVALLVTSSGRFWMLQDAEDGSHQVLACTGIEDVRITATSPDERCIDLLLTVRGKSFRIDAAPRRLYDELMRLGARHASVAEDAREDGEGYDDEGSDPPSASPFPRPRRR